MPFSPPFMRRLPAARVVRSVSLIALAAIVASAICPVVLLAQESVEPRERAVPPESHPRHYWRSMMAGFATSILAHESAHVVTALAVGGRPTVGLSKGRPTVYSGIDLYTEPGKQFLFSSMGLNVQALLDEVILDVPHARGAPFERGVLAGGIATALFYISIGRTASVSDVDFMARTSSLSKTEIAFIYGGVALMHTVRIHRDHRYANFFLRPMPAGERGLRLGVSVE